MKGTSILPLLLGIVLISSAAAQEGHKGHLQPRVDIQPEDIPDQVAWRIFFVWIAEPAGAGEAQAKRQQAKVKKVDLDAADLAKLQVALAPFHAEYDRIMRRIQAIGRYTPEVDQLRAQRETLTTSAIASVERQLSNQGVAKLRKHVREVVKSEIKVVPMEKRK